MSKWWRKVQQTLPKPSSLKKTAGRNAAFVSARESLQEAASRYSRRAQDSARLRGEELGKQARERAAKATSRLTENLKELPSKAAEAGKDALKSALTAGAQSARDAGERATSTVKDAAPKIGSYATWTARRIALLLLGTAFAYGVGSSLPGAMARYLTERERRRDKELTGSGGGGGGGDSDSSPHAVVDGSEAAAELVERASPLLLGTLEALLGKR